MILQSDVQCRADVDRAFGRTACLHRDDLELGVRAHAVQLAPEPPRQRIVVATVRARCHDGPVNDGGEDGARLDSLPRALREHARDGRHEELHFGLCPQDGVASLSLQSDDVPRSFEATEQFVEKCLICRLGEM